MCTSSVCDPVVKEGRECSARVLLIAGDRQAVRDMSSPVYEPSSDRCTWYIVWEKEVTRVRVSDGRTSDPELAVVSVPS